MPLGFARPWRMTNPVKSVVSHTGGVAWCWRAFDSLTIEVR